MAVLATQPRQPTKLDGLAEKLLDKIFAHLTPDARELSTSTICDLAAVSLVSRDFHRIVEPHLYRSVPITVNKCDRILDLLITDYFDPPSETWDMSLPVRAPTTRSCNANHFLRTMRMRPGLSKHVKLLSVRRQDDLHHCVKWRDMLVPWSIKLLPIS